MLKLTANLIVIRSEFIKSKSNVHRLIQSKCISTTRINSVLNAGIINSSKLSDNILEIKDFPNQKRKSSSTNLPDNRIQRKGALNRAITPNILLFEKAFRQKFIIPDFQCFIQDIKEIYEKCKKINDGNVATYIPQLGEIDPELFGISLCTIDGQRYSIGDANKAFTIQSCSKPLTYAIALEYLGQKEVHKYVGQEPSGHNFNELILDYNKQPHNPMINAGAIIICAEIQALIDFEMDLGKKFDFTMNWFKKMSGGEFIGFNNDVYLSEQDVAYRNYALAFYMKEHNCYPERCNLKDVLNFYFQCCSIEVTCETMAVIGATLAQGGICPINRQKVLKPSTVRDVLSIMHSCGTYDYSGKFAFNTGLPAKSGVSGSMFVTIPNVMGICVWSPRLDAMGNSVRGIRFYEELVRIFNFHHYDNLYYHGKKDPRKHEFENKASSLFSLLMCAANNDLDALKSFKLSGFDLSQSDYDGRTALHLAAGKGHFNCVRYLCEHCNCCPDVKDRWGNTPINDAEKSGFLDIVEYLKIFLECGISAIRSNPKFKIDNCDKKKNSIKNAPDRVINRPDELKENKIFKDYKNKPNLK